MVKQWGGYAEVVSRMEYELAQRVGVDPERIIFNGPYKSPNDVGRALALGSVVNVDWPYQLSIVDAVARNSPERQLRVGVRVTFEIPSNQPSRFGFSADDGALSGILAQLRALPNVEVAGLHCHFLTPHRSTTDYRFITSRMLELTATHFREPPAFVNVGGGYFSKMKRELQEQFGIPVPTYRQYAKAIAAQVAASYPNGFVQELILEPGICLTADVVKFIARVIDVHVSGPRRLVLVSGSVYDIKPTLNARNLPLEVIHAEDGGRPTLSGRFDIVGYTCMENDVLFKGFEGTLGVGDYAVFQNVGAYTNVLRPPFIRECPPMLGWNYETNAFEILKRREFFNDVFATYTF
jgi:diaminopimelate decarboxylase